jgi:hypothetical protein
VRWMVRTAYGIPGDPCEDCAESIFCPCCVANQLLHTTNQLKDPFGPAPERHLLRDDPWIGSPPKDCNSFMCGYCCLPCMVGRAMEEGVGMPCWMGCMCITPCAARNVMRYHFRVRNDEDELFEDGIVPCCITMVTHILPPFSEWVSGVYFSNMALQMATESRVRGKAPPGMQRYLAGYQRVEMVGSDPSQMVIQTQPQF